MQDLSKNDFGDDENDIDEIRLRRVVKDVLDNKGSKWTMNGK